MTDQDDTIPTENMPVKTDRPMVGAHEADASGGDDRFFLDKFLGEKKADEDAAAAASAPVLPEGENPELKAKVIEALREIYDPEIPVNIYELGLIYEVHAGAKGDVLIIMTLTTPHCPVAESMPGEIELKVGSVDGASSAQVRLVWEPPWDMSLMSDEARLELGLL